MLIPLAFLLAATDTVRAPADTLTARGARTVIDTTVVGTTVVARPPIEHSDAYYTRLRIHRIGSYTMLPLFGAEYLLGDRLLNGSAPASWVKPTHVGVAVGLGALFASNTVTGLWNLWEARHDEDARSLRYVHAALLLASDVGFAVAPTVLDRDGSEGRTLHRNIALASMSAATLGTVIMWLRRN
jgi:hypothetical protein